MSTPGSFGNSLRNHDYKETAEFLVLAGVNGNLSLEDALNSLYNDYIRLKTNEEKSMAHKRSLADIRVGDIVSVSGIGRIDYAPFGSSGGVAYFDSDSPVRFRVIAHDPRHVKIEYVDKRYSFNWTVGRSAIVAVQGDRRIEKNDRRVENQKEVSSVSSLNVVKCLESVAKTISLSEYEREVLATHQAKIRRDGTANGFRKSDRRNQF